MKMFELIKTIKFKTDKKGKKLKKEIEIYIKIELEKLHKKYKNIHIDYEYYIEKIGNEKYIYINFWKIKKIEKEGYYEIKH